MSKNSSRSNGLVKPSASWALVGQYTIGCFLSDVILQETESHLIVLGCAPVAQLGSLRDAGIVLEQYDRWLDQDASSSAN